MKSYYAFFKVLNNYIFLTKKIGKKAGIPIQGIKFFR